jgi:hypothetical protein
MSGVRNRRAKLRQLALLEPHSSAAREIASVVPGGSIVPTPSVAQRSLEGEIIGRLGYLHEPRNAFFGTGKFIIERVRPAETSLTIDINPDSSVAKLCLLLPSWELDSDAVDNGIVGLRYRLHHGRSAVDFMIPDQSACVTFQGVDTDEFLRFRGEWLSSGQIRSVGMDPRLTAHELRSPWGDSKSAPVASAFIRRYGLLQPLQPKWIDTWSFAHRFCVEVSVPDSSLERTDEVVTRFTSDAFSPTFVRAHPEQPIGYHNPLVLDGTALELDLRITTL